MVMGLPTQLVLRDLDCRQQLQFGREQRSLLLVRGPGGAQMSVITSFRSPWPLYLSLSLPLSSPIRRSGPNRCSSFSSVWKRPPSNSNALGQHVALHNSPPTPGYIGLICTRCSICMHAHILDCNVYGDPHSSFAGRFWHRGVFSF